MENKYVSGKKAQEILGISTTTLHKYDKEGIIETIRTPGNRRMYNLEKYLRENVNNKKENNDLDKQIRRKICYCRVSLPEQKEELQKQIKDMMERYPNYEIISDIGSGLNFKRPGLKKIMDYALKNELQIIVVSYKDRLCRVGYDLIEYIIETHSKGEIIVENKILYSPEEEITNDLIQIISLFNIRTQSIKKYKKDENIDIKL